MTQGQYRLREGLLGAQVPGAIKLVTPAQLLELGSVAQRAGYSAIGRPAWTAEHHEDIKSAVLMPIGLKARDQAGEKVLRCYVGVVVEKLGLLVFTLDVEAAQFMTLPDVIDTWELAQLLLYWAPHLPVDARVH